MKNTAINQRVNGTIGRGGRLGLVGLSCLGALSSFGTLACGDAQGGDLASREAALSEGLSGEELTALDGGPVLAEELCEPEPLSGYRYADQGEIWLGYQGEAELSVNGYGYVVSRDGESPPAVNRYSPELSYSVSPDGTLVDESLHPLLGLTPGFYGECLSVMRAPVAAFPTPTSEITVLMNLSAESPASSQPFDIQDPFSDFSMRVSVIDGVGAQHPVEVFFVKTAPQFYEYHAVVAQEELWPGTLPGGWIEVGYGALQFDEFGALVYGDTPGIELNYPNATPQVVILNFGEGSANGGDGFDGSTNFSGPSFVWSAAHDGYAEGTGSQVTVDGFGAVTVEFTSGQQLVVGHLALARFPDEAELAPAADGSFRETPESGPPVFGRALSPGNGFFQ